MPAILLAMNTADLLAALHRDAAPLVFFNVLMQQLGLPVPAVPTLLVAGSIVSSGTFGAWLLGVAVAASVIADMAWYAAGRLFGYRVLSGLCRLSLNPGSCTSSAERLFENWGVWALVAAKFVPGFSIVGPPIAGALGFTVSRFLLAAALGAMLWAGAALAAGWLLREQVQWALDAIGGQTSTVAAALAIVFGGWVSWKWWQRRRFERLASIPHISAEELVLAMDSPHPPLVLDLRGAIHAAEEGPIPGTTPAQLDRILQATAGWPKNAPVVTLCACPEDASAVMAARTLVRHGYRHVRPLKDGQSFGAARGQVAAQVPRPADVR